jgi:hypothetical protein
MNHATRTARMTMSSASADLYRAWHRLQDAINGGADRAAINELQRRYDRVEAEWNAS